MKIHRMKMKHRISVSSDNNWEARAHHFIEITGEFLKQTDDRRGEQRHERRLKPTTQADLKTLHKAACCAFCVCHLLRDFIENPFYRIKAIHVFKQNQQKSGSHLICLLLILSIGVTYLLVTKGIVVAPIW
jgi:hypothetical protein